MKDVSIVMPLHNPNKDIMDKIKKVIRKQSYKGRIKIIEVNENLGLADSINYGIKKAKTELIVVLEQDCIPTSNSWLSNLVKPLEKGYICSVSKNELPCNLWKNFGLLAKLMSIKEQREITPLMDNKAVAFKKSTIVKLRMFNGKQFKTAGEDFDMYIKMKRIGKIAYPDAKILHWHIHTGKNRFKKELQLSNGFGALVRIYGSEMPDWWKGFFKSIPILGWLAFLANFSYLKLGISGLLWVPLSLAINFVYSYGFWKGFIEKKQTI